MFSRGRILTTRAIRAVTWLLQVAAIAVLYHLAARLGLTMASVQMNTSPFWPPAGIAVAALALLGFRVWPGITLGVLVGSLLTGADVLVALRARHWQHRRGRGLRVTCFDASPDSAPE